jgi:Tfp pilus assembly protein PilO
MNFLLEKHVFFRIGFILFIMLFILIIGYFVDLQSQLRDLRKYKTQEFRLLNELKIKHDQAMHLSAYQAQATELKTEFSNMIAKFAKQAEIPDLIEAIYQAGNNSGLYVKTLQPKTETDKDFYNSLPIDVVVEGGFKPFETFIKRLVVLPKLVTVNNFSILLTAPDESGNKRLTMNLELDTYFYADDLSLVGSNRKFT